MNKFEFVGEIRPLKDSANFKALDIKDFPSGWQNKRLRFNMICGCNRHTLETAAGGWKDESKNVIYTFSAGSNGQRGQSMKVQWAERNDPEIIAQVANFRKFVVDLNMPGALKAAQDAGDDAAVELAKKRRKEFIAEADFVDYMAKLVNSDKIKGLKFKVVGAVEFQYNAVKGQFYRTFKVQKVYRAADDAQPSSDGTMDIFFTADCVSDMDFAAKKQYYVSGYTDFYDNIFKKTLFAPIQLVIDGNGDEKATKLAEGLRLKFAKAEEGKVRKIAVNILHLNGAQTRTITYDDLSEDEKESVDFGLVSLEELIRQYNREIIGERVVETRVIGLAKGYAAGSIEAPWEVSDLAEPVMETEDVVEDIFSDDGGDDIFDI